MIKKKNRMQNYLWEMRKADTKGKAHTPGTKKKKKISQPLASPTKPPMFRQREKVV